MAKLRLSKELFSITIKRLILLITISLAIYSSIFSIYWYLNAINKKNILRVEIKAELATIDDIVQRQLEYIERETLQLSTLSSVEKWIENQHETEFIKDIQKDFMSCSQEKGFYDQIRLIEANGNEIIRINRNKSGLTEIVSSEDLQNKSNRYYFEITKTLENKGIYISPMDLNVENSKIEVPAKPMLRFGTPLFNKNGDLAGVIIINYLADQILDLVRTKQDLLPGSVSMINEEGYWLLNNDPEYEWGFMYPDRSELRMQNLYPEQWKKIKDADFSQFESMNSYMSAMWINHSIDGPKGQGINWVVLYTVNDSQLGISFQDALKYYSRLSIIIVPLLILGSIIVNKIIAQNNVYRDRLKRMALYDGLTDLPNRHLFYERLNQRINEIGRNSNMFAILFMDLDGFKSVNDRYGHEAGDELLKSVAERIKKHTRRSDTVARFGGDEFVVLLANIREKKDSEIVSDKIIGSISTVFTLKKATVNIGCSIGVLVIDNHISDGIDRLLEKADDAMYEAKRKGKNRYELA